ncbi:hypothetical protein TNCV_1870021 [Trichonephila clavipes]|nr:hypothetical protein TNCV_1870021 [Trichonephila clavipes]
MTVCWEFDRGLQFNCCCCVFLSWDTYEIQVEENRDIQYKQNIDIYLHMMIPAYNKKGCAAFHSRGESITGESPTSFSEENTTMPYSGFEPEPTRLQSEGHIPHTGWTASV